MFPGWSIAVPVTFPGQGLEEDPGILKQRARTFQGVAYILLRAIRKPPVAGIKLIDTQGAQTLIAKVSEEAGRRPFSACIKAGDERLRSDGAELCAGALM